MQISIITLPMHANYGGILQGWALSRALQNLGHTVRFLSPVPYARLSRLQKLYTYPYRVLRNLGPGRKIPLHLEDQLNARIERELRQAAPVRRFAQNRLDITEFDPKRPLPLAGSELVLIGSDQIWRPLYSRSFHNDLRETFGRTALRRGMPVVSYAASFGIDRLDEYTPRELRDIRRQLSRFQAVSVREQSGIELCRRLGVEAGQHIDPTLLLDRADYEALIPADTPARSGVMRYFLDGNRGGKSIADEVSGRLGAESFSATPPGSDDAQPVEQWLAGFRDARFVVTDSFHAVIFSIIFGKPFVVVANDSRGNTRLDTLLDMFGLPHHRVADVSDLRNLEAYQPDSEATARVIAQKRGEALQYLNRSTQSN